jgi:hypothetical protein
MVGASTIWQSPRCRSSKISKSTWSLMGRYLPFWGPNTVSNWICLHHVCSTLICCD